MNFDNKYGNYSEIKDLIINDYHEYMYNYFKNENNHDLNFVTTGMIYTIDFLQNDVFINNKLYDYLITNSTNLNAENFRNNFNLIDFMLGILLVIPFGVECINDGLFGELNVNERFNKCIKIIKLNDEKIKIIYKPNKLLPLIDENIKYRFKTKNE